MKRHFRLKKRYWTGLLILVIGVLLYFNIESFLRELVSPRKPFFPIEQLPPKGSRLLVIAPHSDDETLGAGILMHRAVEQGIDVKVVLVTNGDGFTLAVERDFLTLHPNPQEYRKFGLQRQAETLKAVRKLGLKDEDVIFLGYPDRGVAHLWGKNWDPDRPYFDKYTATNVNPYKNSFDKHVKYTGQSLFNDLNRVISQYKPTDIYFPSSNDQHPDHWAVNAFVKLLLAQKGLQVREHLYLVHRGSWPYPKVPLPREKLGPPTKLTGIGIYWQQFPFRTGEAELKHAAILQYRTQIRLMRYYLLSFVRSNELFGIYRDVEIEKAISGSSVERTRTPVVTDPAGDLVTVEVDRAADITGLYSYIDRTDWVSELSVQSAINKQIIYRFHARLIPDTGSPKGLDISWHNGQVTFEKYSANSITGLAGMKVNNINGRLQIRIPVQQLQGIRYIFLNAESSNRYFNFDRTAWRMVRL